MSSGGRRPVKLTSAAEGGQMMERWSVGVVGAIGAVSGGVSAAAASLIGGGDKLPAGIAVGAAAGAVVASALFWAVRDQGESQEPAGRAPSPASRAGETHAELDKRLLTAGRFDHHSVSVVDTQRLVQLPQDPTIDLTRRRVDPSADPVRQPPRAGEEDQADAAIEPGPRAASRDSWPNSLAAVLGGDPNPARGSHSERRKDHRWHLRVRSERSEHADGTSYGRSRHRRNG